MTIKRKIENHNVDPSNFGGLIFEFDFYTTYNTNKHIAERIADDITFNEMCNQKTTEDKRKE